MRIFKMHHPDTGKVADAIEALTILAADAFIALVLVGDILFGLAA